jgi:predicted DNA-binding transcriptional regulator AlpA
MANAVTQRPAPILISFTDLRGQFGLTLSRTTIFRMCRDGRLPHPIKTNRHRSGRLFWRRDEIEAALRALEDVT